MADTLLHISNLKVNYGSDTIINNFAMTLETGEIVCIMGHNGSGKSTLLNSIYGLLPAANGNILFNNRNITGCSVMHRSAMGIGYMPQDNNLFKHLTAKQQIELALSVNKNQGYAEARENIIQFIPAYPEIELKRAGFLSGGERRKLGLAMLMAQGADKLWLLDEPSAGVDKKGINELFEIIIACNFKKNISLIIVEQNRKIGESLSKSIIQL